MIANQTQNRISDERLVELISECECVCGDSDACKALRELTALREGPRLYKNSTAAQTDELIALRASHTRLVEALKSYPSYPSVCMHDAKEDYCPGCRYQHETAVEIWRAQKDAALADARKLERE